MEISFEMLIRATFIGVGATVVMDMWLVLLKRMHIPTLNFALLGRWVGHVFRGKWFHQAIASAAPVRGELTIGWMTHYGIGIGFAFLLVAIAGGQWVSNPRFFPAVSLGVATVIAPLFIMQPAMGAGIASSRTPAPMTNCVRSLVNHTVFGSGLYLTALLIAQFQ
ncbi:MAG TPA: DUF2938 domain-containing protein [Pseudomonadales bacterium]|nr:DUF2938 domain-containing protein [Pseudomonadales bacterium]